MGRHGIGDSARTIARIWHLTLNRLTDTPLAGQLLRVLAYAITERDNRRPGAS